MSKKRILLLAHGKKAEDPKFHEAYRWLEGDGHDIELVKTKSEDDMAHGVQKLVSHFDGAPQDLQQDALLCNHAA